MNLQLGEFNGPKSEGLQERRVTGREEERSYLKGCAGTKHISHVLDGVSQLNELMVTMIEKKQLLTAPPIYPSQVFLGDNAIS